MQREQLAEEHRRELRREKGQLPPEELKNRMVRNVPQYGSVERSSVGHPEERFQSPTPPPPPPQESMVDLERSYK